MSELAHAQEQLQDLLEQLQVMTAKATQESAAARTYQRAVALIGLARKVCSPASYTYMFKLLAKKPPLHFGLGGFSHFLR
ncbi:hypothetical protein DBR45_08180 [Pseudomonas sp. HMWF031]|nr:hypothetical protein DBR45_08180 [Pseudomonas sp. HMWF031]